MFVQLAKAVVGDCRRFLENAHGGFIGLVGLIIALFQALTTIQEMTLTFVPKILVIFVSMILFLPFIRHFAGILSRKFVQEPTPVTGFIHAVPENIPDVALPALAKEVAGLIRTVLDHNRAALELFTSKSKVDSNQLQKR